MTESLEEKLKSVRELWGKEKFDHSKTRFWRKFYVWTLVVVSVLAVPGWLLYRRDRLPSRRRVCRHLEDRSNSCGSGMSGGPDPREVPLTGGPVRPD